MTTVNMNGKEVPFDEALRRARIAYMNSRTIDVHTATKEQLERRLQDVRLYLFLQKIEARLYSGIERRDTGTLTTD